MQLLTLIPRPLQPRRRPVLDFQTKGTKSATRKRRSARGAFFSTLPTPLQPGQSPDLPGTDVPLRCILTGQVWELKNLVQRGGLAHRLSFPNPPS